MSTGYKIAEGDSIYYVTMQIVGWLDVFTRKIYRDIAIDSFKYCQQNKGLNIFAYVIMTNHIHLMARSENGDLSGIIRDFKKYTSKEIIGLLDESNESRRDWIKLVFEYHGRYKDKQTFQVWTREPC